VLRNDHASSVSGLDTERPTQHTDIVRLRRGGVGAQFWSAYVPSSLPESEAVVAALEQIDAIHRLVAAYPETFAFARTAAQVRAAWTSGRIASLIGVEGGHAIARSLPVLRAFTRLGVRYLTLTHVTNTAWADAGTAKPTVGGLNAEGIAVVAELNRIGVLADLSHTSAQTQRDAIAASTVPVIFSHSSAAAVNDHPRNVLDDVLESLARNGGVAQVTFVPDFVSPALTAWSREFTAHLEAEGVEPAFGFSWRAAPRPGETAGQLLARNTVAAGAAADAPDFFALADEWGAAHPRPAVTVADVVPHVEHVREVAGIEHVGLGGDYDGVLFQPTGLEDVSGYPRLLELLAERGWSQADLEALTGGNVLRVLQAAEDGAEEDLAGGDA
jgi:membrane dipeptidase